MIPPRVLVKLGIISTMTLSLLVACGKKDDGGGAAAPVVNNPCAGRANGVLATGQLCNNGIVVVGGSGNLLRNVEFENEHIEGVLNISGSGTGFGYLDPKTYVGMVTISGSLTVFNNLGYCGAPLQTVTVTGRANYYMGAMSMVELSAGAIRIVGNNAIVENPAGLFQEIPGTRFSLVDAQLIVGGQPCFTISTF